MGISVKICGISTEEALEAAIEAGADYAGLVFFKRSPRHLTLARAAELARRANGRISTVALTVGARYGTLKAIMDRVRPDFVQLHGKESVERVAAIRRLTRSRVIKAIRVAASDDIVSSIAFEPVSDLILFDAYAASIPNALPGGNGLAFEWTWLTRRPPQRDFMLSGGLNSDNVHAALAASGARAVDVSSGVVNSPGVKSPALIRKFVRAAKSFEPAAPDLTAAV